MDPQSNDYQFGVLNTEMKALRTAITSLTTEVRALSGEVSEIKLFRAKVVGMALLASTVVSIVMPLLTEAVRSWAK